MCRVYNNIKDSHYSFLENASSDWYAIKLNDKWKGVTIVYGTVSIKESPELDSATLTFNYNIQDPGEYNHDELRKDEGFNNYLGAILQHIISESLYNNEASIGTIKSDPNPYN
jgi:hypothetical protein